MTPSRYPEGSEPENCELVEEIALMRTTVVARTVRSVRGNVGAWEVGGEKSIAM
jgi:hypothetical protein